MTGPDDFSKYFDVSRETLDRLTEYEAHLRKWTAKINLVSKTTLDDIWRRHFVDSAQLLKLFPQSVRKISDFGSGGGFPGLVLAILNREFQPEVEVTLVESDLRKSSFLSTVSHHLDLNTKVVAERVEHAEPQEADIVTARALAALDALLPLAHRHLLEDGCCLFLKGERYKEEVELARREWDFDLEVHESLTHHGSALLHIENLRSKPQNEK